MFCDLVGSTEIAERFDPEIVREILLAYQGCCARVVRRFDGWVGKYLGDGLLVFFGYPRAHEDDARRAVLAGLEMVDEVAALGRTDERVHGVDLALRVGVHTGLVVAAEQGSDRPDQHELFGATTNLASRIQTAADPNSVLISRSTFDLVRGYFEVVELGPTELRGAIRPVELFRVVRPTPAETRLDAVQVRADLVDREAERAWLVEAWERARAGGAAAVLVEGEPGIGKSHLVESLKDHARDCEAQQLTLQCSPYHRNTLLHAVARFLRRQVQPDEDVEGTWKRLGSLVAGAAPAPVDDLCLLAGLADITLPPEVPPPEMTPERRREALFDALTAWVARTAAAAPLLVLLEDLHWADPSTLELFHRLVTGGGADRVLVVLTSRPGHGFTAPVETLRLEPLDPQHRHALVDQVSGERVLPPALRAVVAERSDGIPLYIEELTRMLLTLDDSGTSLPEADPFLDIPATLHDLLMARLDQFPAEKQLAHVVATAGPSASLDLVARLLEQTEDAIRASLRPLLRAGILGLDRTGTTCVFRHVLLRDAAYQSQLRSSRRELHAQIADLLREDFREIGDTQPELLAGHLFEGGRPLSAAEEWYRAGQRMAAQGAHTEATALYHKALAAVEAHREGARGTELELALQGSLGCSLLALQGYTSPEVEHAYTRAVELASAVERQPGMATRFGLWAYWVVRGDQDTASLLARQALEVAEASGREPDIVQASCMLGYNEFYAGRFEPARRLLEIGATWRFSPDEIELPHDPGVASLAMLAPTMWILGQPHEARRIMAEALERADALGFPWGAFTRAYAQTYAAWFSVLAGDPTAAVTHASRAVAVATEYQFPTWFAAGSLHLAIGRALAGSAPDMVPVIGDGVEMWRGAGAGLFLTYYRYGQAVACRLAGYTEGARDAVDQGLAEADAGREQFQKAELLRLRGELDLDLTPERIDEATADLVAAADVARAQGAWAFELRALTSLHRVRARQGRAGDTAAQLATVLASFADAESVPEVADARVALDEAPA